MGVVAGHSSCRRPLSRVAQTPPTTHRTGSRGALTASIEASGLDEVEEAV